MDKAMRYQKTLRTYLESIAQDWTNNPGEEVQVVADQAGRHFLVIYYGWSKQGRIHNVPIHLELREGKVWIQENLTEIEIDSDLVALGIPKSDIVLGVIPPEYRKYAGFATA